jgi:hypothetical protein
MLSKGNVGRHAQKFRYPPGRAIQPLFSNWRPVSITVQSLFQESEPNTGAQRLMCPGISTLKRHGRLRVRECTVARRF